MANAKQIVSQTAQQITIQTSQQQAVQQNGKEPAPIVAKGPTRVEHAAMPLAALTIAYDWNTRLPGRAKVEAGHMDPVEGKDGDPENPGIPGLARSLELRGQDIPITVAILGETSALGKPGTPFVANGFRRTLAVEWLAKNNKAVFGLKVGEISCKVVYGLDDSEIRNINIRENVRDQVPPSDLCFGLMDLVKSRPEMTQKEMAELLGKSEGYVSQLVTIGTNLRKDLFRQWRESTIKPLGHLVVYAIAKRDPKEQAEAFAKAIEAQGPKPSHETDPSAWFEATKIQGTKLGFQLGTLARLGVIKGIVGDGANLIDHITEIPGFRVKSTVSTVMPDGSKRQKDVSSRTHRAIAKAVLGGYDEGMKEPPSEDDADDNDEDEDA